MLQRLRTLRQRLESKRFCTETIFGDRDKAQDTIRVLRSSALDILRREPHTMAIGLAGSRAIGTATDLSDVDLVILPDRIMNLRFLTEKSSPPGEVAEMAAALGDLKIDLNYQRHIVQYGLYDAPENSRIVLFRGARSFIILAARQAYFETMEQIAGKLRQVEWKWGRPYFEKDVLKVCKPATHRILNHLKTPGTIDLGMRCVYTKHTNDETDDTHLGTCGYCHHIMKLAAISSLDIKEVMKIFDLEYFYARRHQGLISMENEVARLREEREALGMFLVR